jgi:translation initiation factor 3 subunit A
LFLRRIFVLAPLQELERKLARLAKNMDHLERARREEEAPLLEAAYQARLSDDKTFHEQQQLQQAEAHKLAWEVDIQEKKRCAFAVKCSEVDVFQPSNCC